VPKKRPQKTDPADTPEADRAAAEAVAAGDTAPERAAAEQVPSEDAATQTVGADKRAAETAAGAENPQDLASSEPEPLRAELEEAKDRALRSQAELENYRKRVAREMQEERRYANLPLIRDLLPVLDNMDRATKAAEKTHDAAGLLEGVKLVARQLEGVLEQHHCVRIEAHNESFDPHLHEAVSQQPSDEHPANTVVQVTQTGFRLHDRVVRPSQVIVSTRKE
jgi:molecular chaperone GrpE